MNKYTQFKTSKWSDHSPLLGSSRSAKNPSGIGDVSSLFREKFLKSNPASSSCSESYINPALNKPLAQNEIVNNKTAEISAVKTK